jgi:hypothetical protein
MQPYLPPVAGFLELGYPNEQQRWRDYTRFGIGPEHIPELIRLMRDKELLESIPETDDDDPRFYGYIHAWRALGQLRAAEAIEPLLDMLVENANPDEWNDWIMEEVPTVLGMIGPAAIPATVARLDRRGKEERPHIDYSNALTEIAKRHPDSRGEVVSQFSRILETAAENDPALNGFVISDLIDLEARESWPVIEAAYATENVDPSITGDADEVKWRLGLGPEPPRARGFYFPPQVTTGEFRPEQVQKGPSAKQRFNERQRQKKLAKKQKKKKK